MKRFALVFALAACSTGSPANDTPPVGKKAQPMSVEQVEWNLGKADVGKVAAVAEVGDAAVVYSDKGMLVFSGGAVSAADTTVTTWTYATTIPRATAPRPPG